MKGVTITRDKFKVLHVRSKTYAGGIWASGWLLAEDRSLLLEQARYNSRVAAIGVPGLKALDLISQLKSFKPSRQTEKMLAAQSKELQKAGKEGRLVLRDIDTFVSGINARYKQAKVKAAKWTRSDVYALDALKGQFVGQGGGGEALRTQFYSALINKLGSTRGRQVFNDLRQHDDPESPRRSTEASPTRRFRHRRRPAPT